MNYLSTTEKKGEEVRGSWSNSNKKNYSNNSGSKRSYSTNIFRFCEASTRLTLVPYNYISFCLVKHISTLQDYSNENKFPKKLSNYLIEIRDILRENKDNPKLAQEHIEKKWLDIASQGFKLKPELLKREKFIFESAFEFL